MKKIVSLDVGDQRIGIAVSDAFGWTAQGLETYCRSSLKQDIDHIKAICQTHQAQAIVVGLPRNMDGSLGEQAEKTRVFSDALAKQICIELILWDERLSTMAAQRYLLEGNVSRRKRKQVIDKMAAVQILQNYLHYLENQRM